MYTFAGRSSIDDVSFGDSLLSIGDYAFSECTSIDTVIFPNTVSTIGQYSFQNCTALSDLTFGSSLLSIGDYAFSGCSSVDIIHFPNTLSTIGQYSFQNCTALSDLTFGNSLELISMGAFMNCSSISNVIITDNIQTIGDRAFYNCDNLLTLNSNNVHTIGEQAFSSCDRLITVSLCNSVTVIGSQAFKDCYRMMDLSLGPELDTIGDSAFQGCSRLRKPVLPEGLLSIGSYAFDGCGDIVGRLSFPASITNIGDYAYNGVGTIDDIEMVGSNPPTIYQHTFAAVDSLVPVYVPCGSVLQYYTTDWWENFPSLQENTPFHLTVSENNSVMGTATVTQQPTCSNYTARIQATANSGYHFLQWNDGNTANPRQLTMTQDTEFVAQFAVNYCYITVNSNDETMGSASGTGLYNYNAPVTMTATSLDGYHFLRWSDGVTQNPRYLQATRDSSFTAIFASNVSSITVASANPDMGAVGGSGVYYYQNLITITATANYGYHFTQWNDGNSQNPRTITVSQDSAFTAYFAPNNYTIVASSNNSTMGSVTGSGSYTYLHEMSMTATAAYGYHFVQWNDGITDNPRTITVRCDSAFTAQFAANSYLITVESNDPSMGSAYGGGSYNYGAQATLSAAANAGYHFSQWSDGNTDNPRIITVSNNASFTAVFVTNNYVLNVVSGNPVAGTVSGSGTYEYMSLINITATPYYGYHFTQWNDNNTENPRMVTVTQNSTYTAQFAPNEYAVAVVSANPERGTATGSGTYNYNASIEISAVAEYGFHFVQWSDGNTNNPRTVTVTGNATYTAVFEPNSYTLTVTSSNPAIGTAQGGGSYSYMTVVNITATPNAGYHFTQWADGNTDNPRTVTVTQNATYTAQFAINGYAVQVTSNNSNMGSVTGSGSYTYGSPATMSATPYYGYHFVQWQDGNTDNPRTVVVTNDAQYTAQFVRNSYLITANSSNVSMGTATGGGSYEYLQQVMLTAVPMPHYHFTMWNDSIEDNPRTVTVTRDSLFTAHFAIDRHTVSIGTETPERGEVTGSQSVDYLTAIYITATANYGYHFTQWSDGNTSNPRRVVVECDTSFTAEFEPNQYTALIQSGDEVMGSVSTTGGSYPYLTSLTVSVTANYGYHFTGWSDGVTDNPRTIVLTQDTSITAIFEINVYTLTVSCNNETMGSVTGGGDYNYQSQVSVSATAAAHHHFLQWSDGNTSNPRLVTVLSDTAFMAIFESDPQYQITVTVNDDAGGTATGGGMFYAGETAIIEAAANEHYYFVSWSDGVSSNPRQVTVIENVTYTALFSPESYVVNITANDYTMGSVSGTGTYTYGSVATIAAQPFDNYRFVRWSDGDETAVRQILVEENISLEAQFEAIGGEPTQGIAEAKADEYKVYVRNGRIEVEGAEGMKVTVYDLTGRTHDQSNPLPRGVYMLKVGEYPAKKVVVW